MSEIANNFKTVFQKINGDISAVSGALSEKQDVIDENTKLAYDLLSGTPAIPSATSDLVNDSDFATSGYVDAAVSGKQDIIDAENKLDYELLSGTPAIPTSASELINDAFIPSSLPIQVGVKNPNNFVNQGNNIIGDATLLGDTRASIFLGNGDRSFAKLSGNSNIFLPTTWHYVEPKVLGSYNVGIGDVIIENGTFNIANADSGGIKDSSKSVLIGASTSNDNTNPLGVKHYIINGENSVNIGTDNAVSGVYNAVTIGKNNKLTKSNQTLIGSYLNSPSSEFTTTLGSYNDTSNDYAFAVGDGNRVGNVENRSNIIEISKGDGSPEADAHITIGHPYIEDGQTFKNNVFIQPSNGKQLSVLGNTSGNIILMPSLISSEYDKNMEIAGNDNIFIATMRGRTGETQLFNSTVAGSQNINIGGNIAGGGKNIILGENLHVHGYNNVSIGGGSYPYDPSNASFRYNYIDGSSNVNVGPDNLLSGSNSSYVFGYSNKFTSTNNITVVGKANTITGSNTVVVLGNSNTASNISYIGQPWEGVAIVGQGNTVSNTRSVVIGQNNSANNGSLYTYTIGMGNHNSGGTSVVVGLQNTNTTVESVVIGNNLQALSGYTTIGRYNSVDTGTNGDYEFALGTGMTFNVRHTAIEINKRGGMLVNPNVGHTPPSSYNRTNRDLIIADNVNIVGLELSSMPDILTVGQSGLVISDCYNAGGNKVGANITMTAGTIGTTLNYVATDGECNINIGEYNTVHGNHNSLIGGTYYNTQPYISGNYNTSVGGASIGKRMFSINTVAIGGGLVDGAHNLSVAPVFGENTGAMNDISGSLNIAMGRGLVISDNEKTVIGTYNVPSNEQYPSARFVIADGSNDHARHDFFVKGKNGALKMCGRNISINGENQIYPDIEGNSYGMFGSQNISIGQNEYISGVWNFSFGNFYNILKPMIRGQRNLTIGNVNLGATTASFDSIVVGTSKVNGNGNLIVGTAFNQADGYPDYMQKIIEVSGNNNVVLGKGIKFNGNNQTVVGRFNAESENPFVIANGTAYNNRRNALEITSDNDVIISGNIINNALSTALDTKLDTPSGGTVGQVLTKTADGEEWSDAQGGGGDDPTYQDVVDFGTVPKENDEFVIAVDFSKGPIQKIDIDHAVSGTIWLTYDADSLSAIPAGKCATVEVQIPLIDDVTYIQISDDGTVGLNIPETLEAHSSIYEDSYSVTYHDFVFRTQPNKYGVYNYVYVNYSYSFQEDGYSE